MKILATNKHAVNIIELANTEMWSLMKCVDGSSVVVESKLADKYQREEITIEGVSSIDYQNSKFIYFVILIKGSLHLFY